MAGKSRNRRGTGNIPVLTDAVDAGESLAPVHAGLPFDDKQLAELQREIASRARALARQIAAESLQALEAPLQEQLSARLQQKLPELIDAILRKRLPPDERS